MKMDNGRHEQGEFHFTPIARQLGDPIPPDAPFDPGPGSQESQNHPGPIRSDSRAVIPFYYENNLPAPTTVDSDRRRQYARTLINHDIDIRFASAREMAAISMELYVQGLVSWDEYARLAFQPELHPDYDATIGALLEEHADPDKPQDFVRIWEERLVFERRYNAGNKRRVRATERITLMMRRLAGIPSLRA